MGGAQAPSHAPDATTGWWQVEQHSSQPSTAFDRLPDMGEAIRGVEWPVDDAVVEVVDADAGATLLDHTHDTPHLLVILQGALYEGERAMRRGELRISPAGDRHFVRFLAPARVLLLHAPGRITTSERLVSSARRSLLTLADSLSPENVHSSHAARDAAALVKRVVASAEELLDERQVTGVPSWLRELHARATSDITSFTRVAALAKYAGVSREHLTRSFRRCYGTSVTSFLRVTRLVHAYDRVKASAAPLAAIAADCGFADQSHMTRLFITHFGASPAALRAQTTAQVTSVQAPRVTL